MKGFKSSIQRLRENQLNSRLSNRTRLAEPLLICDLPGQNINFGAHIRDDSQEGLGYLDHNVQGSNMSFDVETIGTLPIEGGAQNPRETL